MKRSHADRTKRNEESVHQFGDLLADHQRGEIVRTAGEGEGRVAERSRFGRMASPLRCKIASASGWVILSRDSRTRSGSSRFADLTAFREVSHPVHGSESLTTNGVLDRKFKYLPVRPELVEGRRARCDTLSLGRRVCSLLDFRRCLICILGRLAEKTLRLGLGMEAFLEEIRSSPYPSDSILRSCHSTSIPLRTLSLGFSEGPRW